MLVCLLSASVLFPAPRYIRRTFMPIALLWQALQKRVKGNELKPVKIGVKSKAIIYS